MKIYLLDWDDKRHEVEVPDDTKIIEGLIISRAVQKPVRAIYNGED